MDAEACLQAIAASLPELDVRSVRPVDEGWDSFVLEVNHELIFRFPRRVEIEAALEMEARLLPALAPTLSLAVPRFEHVCRRADGCLLPFAAYRRISGAPLDPASLPPAQARDAAHRLGRFLGELQRFPRSEAVGLGVRDASPNAWRAEYQAFYARVREQVLPLLSASSRLRWQARWEEFLGWLEHLSFQPVLLHRDLTANHILYDAAQGALAGVIDWEDASIGDPAFDFAGPFHDYGRAYVEEVLWAYPGAVDGAFLDRARFYGEIIPFHEASYGLMIADRRLVRQGVARLELEV